MLAESVKQLCVGRPQEYEEIKEVMKNHFLFDEETLKDVSQKDWVLAGLPLGLLFKLRKLENEAETDGGMFTVAGGSSTAAEKNPSLLVVDFSKADAVTVLNDLLIASHGTTNLDSLISYSIQQFDAPPPALYNFTCSVEFAVPHSWHHLVKSKTVQVSSELYPDRLQAKRESAKKALRIIGVKCLNF
jgi:hypothetical protein